MTDKEKGTHDINGDLLSLPVYVATYTSPSGLWYLQKFNKHTDRDRVWCAGDARALRAGRRQESQKRFDNNEDAIKWAEKHAADYAKVEG